MEDSNFDEEGLMTHLDYDDATDLSNLEIANESVFLTTCVDLAEKLVQVTVQLGPAIDAKNDTLAGSDGASTQALTNALQAVDCPSLVALLREGYPIQGDVDNPGVCTLLSMLGTLLLQSGPGCLDSGSSCFVRKQQIEDLAGRLNDFVLNGDTGLCDIEGHLRDLDYQTQLVTEFLTQTVKLVALPYTAVANSNGDDENSVDGDDENSVVTTDTGNEDQQNTDDENSVDGDDENSVVTTGNENQQNTNGR